MLENVFLIFSCMLWFEHYTKRKFTLNKNRVFVESGWELIAVILYRLEVSCLHSPELEGKTLVFYFRLCVNIGNFGEYNGSLQAFLAVAVSSVFTSSVFSSFELGKKIYWRKFRTKRLLTKLNTILQLAKYIGFSCRNKAKMTEYGNNLISIFIRKWL